MYSFRKYVLPGACALVALTLCACRGRHADGTPTGETVEVNVEEFAAVDSAAGMPAVYVDTATPAAPAVPASGDPEVLAEPVPAPAEEPAAPAQDALHDPALPSSR